MAGGAALSNESGTITSVTLTETSIVKVIIFNANNEEIISATKTITLPEAPEAGTPVPDVPLEQLVISLLTDDDHDELEFIGGFHDSETSEKITDTDISDVMFIIDGNTYSGTVSYDNASKHLIIRHAFEGAYTGTIPETGILAFTYNDETTQFTLALEDARE